MHFRQKTSLAQSALRVIFSMKQSEPIDKQKARKGRLALVVVGLMAICTGSIALFGKLHYSNYWGAAVFAPFAVFVGLLALTGAFLLRKK
jgi:uncharacterized membrane protein HdeD (DUF308 family)